ncbi:jg8712 [Pararge aegeria aegeria]|uniref:Jg8712 protein n=1 Tax=Pararge aegeria aegeria TaxID=348720 RepID=A0A8S4SB64_9NEOP|nr:jg8712 [Pararge aegeria aegeria]
MGRRQFSPLQFPLQNLFSPTALSTHRALAQNSAGDGEMLGVSLRDQIRNEEIHSSHRAHSSENRWTLDLKVLECRTPTRLTDDIWRVAGSRWRQVAQDSALWNSLQKTNVQQWTFWFDW